jgi:regulatory protein
VKNVAYITKITTQKKQTGRFNIYVNDGGGEKYAFSVDEDVLIKYQLKKGTELDEFTQMEVLFQDTIRKAIGTAIQYLSHRMRSEKEVKDHLKEKEIDDTVIQEVIHRLYNLNYLNEEEFAYAYVRTQINTTDKGPNIIKQELREKGVNGELLEKVLLEYTDDLQFSKAVQLTIKAQKKQRNDSQFLFEQKLKQTLSRKGFPFSIIDEAVTEMKKTIATDQDKVQSDAIKKHGEKAIKKYGEDWLKVKQVLYRKGFTVEEIEEYISSLDHSK